MDLTRGLKPHRTFCLAVVDEAEGVGDGSWPGRLGVFGVPGVEPGSDPSFDDARAAPLVQKMCVMSRHAGHTGHPSRRERDVCPMCGPDRAAYTASSGHNGTCLGADVA
jgi:hypothetical protein